MHDTLTTIQGCDSALAISVEVYPEYNFSSSDTACEFPFYWEVSGDSLFSTGTYNASFTTINGCDSLYSLALFETIIDTSLTIEEDTIISNQEDATYQWFVCEPALIPQFGDTLQSFVPSQSGFYLVSITIDGCTDSSACINHTMVSTSNPHIQNIDLYPTPAEDLLSLRTSLVVDQLVLIDLSRRIVAEYPGTFRQIDVSSFPAGLYLLQFHLESGVATRMVLIQ